jgi:hypothetical protein
MKWVDGLNGCERGLRGSLALAALCLSVLPGLGQSGGSYYEFGTVVEAGAHTVEVQAYDRQTQRMVQHSFLRNRETKADPLRVGDEVEVIFTANGREWTARRVVVLPVGFPSAGPAPVGPPEVASEVPPTGAGTRAKGRSLPPAPVVRIAKAPTAVDLSSKNGPKVAAITPVPLGIAAGYGSPAPVPVTRTIAREEPTAACHQSDPNWGNEPLSIAVLDFRYPTEREEAHDIGKASGGSGMAVADLVYTRLRQLPDYAIDRGDSRRLDRSDIAGAARLGRELGVDAVLEGTFFPVQDPPTPDGFEGKLRGYELHAGLVDTCTGQVLMKLASMSCPAGTSGGGSGCTPLSVTTKEAEDPESYAGAFNSAITAMLYPLEHNGGSVNQIGPAGVVVLNQNGTLTVRLANGMSVRPGEQLSVRATRLTKNPTTYTLENLHDQEIGRLTIKNVQGVMATGSYVGDMPAKVGDALQTLSK